MLPAFILLGYVERAEVIIPGQCQEGQSWAVVLNTLEVFCPAKLPGWVVSAWARDVLGSRPIILCQFGPQAQNLRACSSQTCPAI